MNNHFWRGKRVLLTGHTGFKGGWLSIWLHHLGAEVTGVSLPAHTSPSLYEDAVSRLNLTSIMQDIRETGKLQKVIKDANPEVIFHLAAQALVRPSYRTPVETFETNVMGTVNVLEAARHLPDLKAIVIVTSDKCYENNEWLWPYRECDPMGGFDPYSASKGCAELVTAAFRQSFFQMENAPGVASARAGNVIGGGDWSADRLVPDIIKAFLNKEKPLIRNPGAIRPWQHVLEPLSGYLTLAEALARQPRELSSAWNFGPGDNGTRTVGEITAYLCGKWPDAQGWEAGCAPQPHEAGILKLDSSKARTGLSWNPRLNVECALDWVTDWYYAHATKKADAMELTLNQIADYEQRHNPENGPC